LAGCHWQDIAELESSLIEKNKQCRCFHQLPPDMLAARTATLAAEAELQALRAEFTAAIDAASHADNGY
jgi:hypothetical protein